MRVEELMTSKVFTVNEHDMIDRVFFLINYEKVRHKYARKINLTKKGIE